MSIISLSVSFSSTGFICCEASFARASVAECQQLPQQVGRRPAGDRRNLVGTLEIREMAGGAGLRLATIARDHEALATRNAAGRHIGRVFQAIVAAFMSHEFVGDLEQPVFEIFGAGNFFVNPRRAFRTRYAQAFDHVHAPPQLLLRKVLRARVDLGIGHRLGDLQHVLARQIGLGSRGLALAAAESRAVVP